MLKSDLHGGNIYGVDLEKRNQIIDYSSNINPKGISEFLKKKIIENINIIDKYPDPYYSELRRAIGEYNGVSNENIIVGNGAVEILFQYFKGLTPKKVLIVSPTFAEYERAALSIKCEIYLFELKEKQNFELNEEELINFVIKEKFKKDDLVIICNPNNPTGKFIELEKIEKINVKLKEEKIRLLIDECFIDFIENWKEKTAAKLKDDNIFIMRAFTKFFAIPGLRLGYGIIFEDNIKNEIAKIREPWSVNSFAELAGRFLINDNEYIIESENWIKNEKKWVYEKLLENKNIFPYKTEANFILIKLLTIESKSLKEKILKKNFLIRDASNFKFLNNQYIRIAIKDRENNKKIIEIINEETKWKQY